MLFCWTFYLSKNDKQKYNSFQKNIKQHNCFQHREEIRSKKFSSSITEKIYILKYIKNILDRNISQ